MLSITGGAADDYIGKDDDDNTQLLQGVCDKHPFDPALRNCGNNPQLLDHRRLPCIEGGGTFLGLFLDNFGLKLHTCFSVLLADGHRTNGDQ